MADSKDKLKKQKKRGWLLRKANLNNFETKKENYHIHTQKNFIASK